MGMGRLHTRGCDAPGVLSETLMEILACLNTPVFVLDAAAE